MALTLDDIIKTERDRLFVIDRECFIVFTGDSLDDEKPFIRIGTYVDLPVEIIPLVENIVITDTMVGNPAIEQFNIDITYLDTNRFIGSRAIVRRYLEFQKVFGLDLGAAKVVDIDTDIPDISNERLISNRDSFVGIFYKNGNFKIIHNNRDIFNLQEIDREGNQDIARAHDALSEAFRGTAEMCEGRLRFHGFFLDSVLLPMMLVVVMFFVGFFATGLLLPLISLIQHLS